MHSPASTTMRAGLFGGALLYLHALLPNSHAYPFIWPLLGGALALYWGMSRSGSGVSLSRTVGIGVTTGTIAALVAVAAVVPTYLFLTTEASTSVGRLLGGAGPLPYSPAALRALLLVMLLAVPAALLGSVVTWPFARARGPVD